MKIIEAKLLKNQSLIFDNSVVGKKYDHNITTIKFNINDIYDEYEYKYVIIKDSNGEYVAMYLLNDNCFKISQTITKNAGEYGIVLLITNRDITADEVLPEDALVCASNLSKIEIIDNGLDGTEQVIVEGDENYEFYIDKLSVKMQAELKKYIDDTVDVESITEQVLENLDTEAIAEEVKQDINLDNYYTKDETTQAFDDYVQDHKADLKGDKGDVGPAGPKGDTGTSIDEIKQLSYENKAHHMRIYLDNDEHYDFIVYDGNDGQQGPKGDTGATGATGPAGKDGTNGKDGKDGTDYVLTDADKTEIENVVKTDTKSYVDTYILGGAF